MTVFEAHGWGEISLCRKKTERQKFASLKNFNPCVSSIHAKENSYLKYNVMCIRIPLYNYILRTASSFLMMQCHIPQGDDNRKQ